MYPLIWYYELVQPDYLSGCAGFVLPAASSTLPLKLSHDRHAKVTGTNCDSPSIARILEFLQQLGFVGHLETESHVFFYCRAHNERGSLFIKEQGVMGDFDHY